MVIWRRRATRCRLKVLMNRAQRYYRAEVYLHNGSQDYDLMGFTQDQITRDVLDQFESHRQLLGRVYS